MKGIHRVHRHALIYPVCIIVLLLSNGVILWKHMQLRRDIELQAAQPRTKAIEALMSRPIQTANGEPVILADAQARYVVLFAFTQADCMPCLSELTTLNRISQVRRDTKVYGLMGYASPDEVRQTQQNFDFSFPVLPDPTGAVLESLHLPKTPWKIVLSVPSKQIVYEDLPGMTEVEREAFIERVAQLDGG